MIVMADVQKYACPKCGYAGIVHGQAECPSCHKTFNWTGTASTTTEDRRDTSKNYLLNGYYWFKMLSMFFPVLGIVLLILNKNYKNNLNRQKSNVYDRFFKNVVTYTVVWVLIIVVLAVAAGISYNKAKNAA